MDWSTTTARRDEKHLCFKIRCVLYKITDGKNRKWTKAAQPWCLSVNELHSSIYYVITNNDNNDTDNDNGNDNDNNNDINKHPESANLRHG